ncbi:hypothetical protein PWT90_03904 [Aphanocladium album]|nr:hypothetical protein PWT90_03904 [Aphanocladium album]
MASSQSSTHISDSDLERIWGWNATVPEPVYQCVHDLIAEVTSRQPKAEAICAWNGSLTYEQLDIYSTRLAHHLMNLGVGLGSIVLLCFEKSMWTPVAVLAVMKAGGASVAVDLVQPEDRLRVIAEQVQPALIISSVRQEPVASRLLSSLPASASVVVLDEPQLAQLPAPIISVSLPKVDPNNLLYIVFTSGSTGKPKGVSIRHYNLCSAVKYQQRAHGFMPDSRVYDFASYAFDVSWMNVLHALTAGGCLCIPSEEDRRDNFSESIMRLRVTYAEMTPTMAYVLSSETAKTLQTIVLGGEKVTREALERFPKGVEVKNTYGPSECTPTSTITTIDLNTEFQGSIGTGYGVNTWITSPEDHNSLVPIGTIGELVIEGPLVGAGYIGEPEKTAAVFINDPPWLTRGGPGHAGRSGRVYKTGDLVQYNQDGEILFVGRQDTQIKINGQRTEIGELEHIVKDCLTSTAGETRVVIEYLTPKGGRRPLLVAFLDVNALPGGEQYLEVLKENGVALEERLTRRLPANVVISAFIPIYGFPLMVSGKLDRRNLRFKGEAFTLQELNTMNPCRRKDKRAPSTETEQKIQQLWASVLDIAEDSIGVEDSFLRVGGDSITVMKFVALAREQGLHMTVAEILKGPSLGELAEGASKNDGQNEAVKPFSLLQSSLKTEDIRSYASKICSVSPSKIEDVFPCTPLQEGLLALTAKRAGDYIGQETFQLLPEIDAGRFRSAWNTFVSQNPILRTRMIDVPGQGIVQVVIDEGDVLATGDDAQTLDYYAHADRSAPMDLGTSLLRARLVQQSKGNFLIWTIHHALFDGWTVPLMLGQIEKIYHASDSSTSPSPPFQNFVKHIISNDEGQLKGFWDSQLQNLEAPVFPSLPSPDFVPSASATMAHHIKDLQWPQAGVTPTMALRAAWSIIISQYTSSKDVLFGATVAGRHAPVQGLDILVGPTIATVPLRVQLDYSKTVTQFLTDMQKQSVDMIEFEQSGLLKISRVSADAKAACQFQTLLVVQPNQTETSIGSTLFAPGNYGEEGTPDQGLLGAFDTGTFDTYAVNIICHLESDGVWIQMNYDSNVFSTEKTTRMVSQMEHVLRQMCIPEKLDCSLAETITISSPDLHDIWSWNAVLPETVDRCVHELIAETTEQQPAAEAIHAWDGKLTYKELDVWSTKLAGYLTSQGVGMGSIVPLCFEKSMWTPVAMLAVMKAGGASVAMDPEQPEQRLRTIVQQIQPKLLLSSAKYQALAQQIVASTAAQVVSIDEAWLTQATAPVESIVLPVVKPSSSLFILFTSGTTGTPKGVLVTHSNFSTAIRYQKDFFGYSGPHARVYDFSSYAFDAAWLNLLFALTGGACLCIPSQDERRDDLEGSMERFQVTHIDMTPTAASLLTEAATKRLQGLTLGGERLRPLDAQRWSKAVKSVNNMYGPSECTATATILRVTSDMVSDSIGVGVGLCTWIVDPQDSSALVPIGCVGELLLEGPLVGPGYLGQPDKTAAAFIEDPPWLVSGGRRGRLYKTGDLVRYHQDGSIIFMGRKDTQVKFNGQRLELEGLEHVIQKSLVSVGHASAAVEVITPSQAKKAVLVAFLEIGASEKDEFFKSMHAVQHEVEEKLTQSLPTNIIISAFIPRNGFPLTTAGKIDRRMLRSEAEVYTLDELTSLNPYHTEEDKRPPTTEAERTIQELWSSTLGISPEAIGADDSFLRIGGDSVSAMRVVGLARQKGIYLTVAEILKRPRLSDLATVVGTLAEPSEQSIVPFSLISAGADSQKTRLDAAKLCSVSPDQIQDVFPCTPLQEGLLALTARRAGDYVAQEVFEVRQEVDPTRFKAAWHKWVAETPILRTRIINLPGEGLVQVVVDEAYTWPATVTTSSSQGLDHYMREDKKHLMGLGMPLMRFRLVLDGERHVLVWTIHHALYDGWSMAIMLSTLEDTYNGNALASSPPYQAFVKHVKSVGQERIAQFWSNQLQDLEAQSFPALPSPNYTPDSGDFISHSINGLTWPKTDATPTVVLRAALSVIISQYTGLRDIILGTTVAGRHVPVPGVERMVGPTIATVPLRVQLDHSQSVMDLLSGMQNQMTKMIEFEQAGLLQISQISPEAKAACQFQTLLVVQPDEETQTAGGLFALDTEDDHDSMEQRALGSFDTYAINIICQLKQGGVKLQVNYDKNIVTPKQINKIVSQLEFMLQQFCASSLDSKLSDFISLNTADLSEIWNWNAAVPETAGHCVHELIAATTAQQPTEIAVCAWDGELTYQELDTLSTKLARHLVSLGIKGFVPLCFEKSKWTPVAMLAVMKAGAASVAMDPAQPEERLKTIIQQVQPTLVLSSAGQREVANRLVIATTATAVTVDEAALALLPAPSSATQMPAVKPEDPVYVVFTSGSTGNPKGVLVTHSNISSAIKHQQQPIGLNKSSRVYDFASYTFDLVWCNLLQGLAAGGTLCIPSDETRRTSPLQGIGELSANLSLLTPSTIRALDMNGLANLDTLHLIGESFRQDDIANIPSKTAIHNMYGPSECTTFATLYRVPETGGSEKNIGRGVGLNTWVTEVGDHNILTPVGGVGELLLEGPLVSLGYLNEPEKTAQVFIEDPTWLLRGVPGSNHAGRRGRLYKTGDLVRYNQDGTLTFIGRKDNQVKVNGQRLELGEVEHAVHKCLPEGSEINVVVELVMPAKAVKPVLVAFLDVSSSVTIADGDVTEALRAASKPIVAALEERLAEQLPAYMTPSAFIPVLGFPLTASGKTDRRSLRAKGQALTLEELTAIGGQQEKQAPQTETERKIQDLWASILNISLDSIGRDDSFLRIGGDSISVMKLVEAARQQDIFLTVADVFKSPRLSDLAASVSERGHVQVEETAPFSLLQPGLTSDAVRSEASKLCAVAPAQVEDVFPCTPLQQGLLALTAKRSGDYVGQEIFTLHQTIDIARFKDAWRSLVATTPILRTRIIDLPGQGIVQVVVKEQPEWPADNENVGDIQSLGCIDRLQPMGLGTPLTRFRLVQQAGHHHLVWTIHHALYDGWSLLSMLNTLEKAYTGEEISAAVPFQGFVSHMVNSDPMHASTFWGREMEGLEAPCFPALPSYNYQPTVDQSISRHISGLSWPQVDVTPSIAIRAAWSIVAAQYTGVDDVVFGATVAGRSAAIPGVESMVGPAIATVPLRVRIDDRSKTVAQFLVGMQEQAVRLIEFEQTGLSQISRISAEAKAASQFQTLLVVQPIEETEIGSDVFLPDSDDNHEAGFAGSFDTYALNVICDLEQDGLQLQITYDGNVIAPEVMKRITAQLENVLRQLCNADSLHGKLADVVSINDHDLEEIWKWNATVPEALDRCVHDLIKETVNKQPHAPAINAWDGQFTYQELDKWSTRLAHRLVELGLRAGSIVPICFEKSMWTSVAMLAVMKAGGASAALDPAQSEERLCTIVQQLQPQLILTSPKTQQLASRLTQSPGTSIVAVSEAHLNQLPDYNGAKLPTVTPKSPLFVLFTSGTTGTPKGVIVTHSNFSSTILHQHSYFGYNASARVFDFSSYAFDAAWLNLLLSLSGGACLCVPSDDGKRNDLAGSMERFGITHIDMTPTAAGLLPESALRQLHTMTLGGEALRPVDAQRWASLVKNVRNMYGPSECTATATILSIDTEAMVKDSIGSGVGLCTWIVDAENTNSLMPIGCVGELLLEGPLVGPGYLNEPEKTAKAFIEDPTWLVQGHAGTGRHGRLYKTGDLVRYHHDGSIIYVGRKDTQVKVNGQRLELGGVEHVIQEFLAGAGGEAGVVVELVKPSQAHKPVLVAFLDSAATEVDELKKKLQAGIEEVLIQYLPTNVIITAFLPVSGFPLTATGKLDRKSLRAKVEALTLEELTTANIYQVEKRTPTTANERTIQELWAAVLGISTDGIGADDSFMRVGGDSISAMRLVGAARQRGFNLTVADVLLHPKLSDAALRLQRIEDHESADDVQKKPLQLLPPTIPHERLEKVLQKWGSRGEQAQDVLPVTDEQARSLSMTYSASRNQLFYHTLDCSSEVDLLTMIKACSILVSQFDILRTAFIVEGDSFLQVVLKSMKPEVPIILANEGEDIEQCTTALLQSEKSKRLELGVPLTKFYIIYSEELQTYRVVMRLGHAQFDAISLGLIWSAFEELCMDGVKASPEPVSCFSAHMEILAGLDKSQAVSYWSDLLNGSAVTKLNQTVSHAFKDATDISITKSIPQSQLSSTDYTFSTVLSSAWAYVLAKRLQRDDVVLGILAHGRDQPASERVAGLCFNVVPVRVMLKDGWRVQDLLDASHSQRVASIPFSHLGSREIVRGCTDWSQDAYFGTVIRHNSYSDDEDQASRMNIFESLGSSPSLVDIDSVEVHITAISNDKTIEVEISFAANVVPTEVAHQLAADLQDTILQFYSSLDAPLQSLNKLPAMKCTLPVVSKPIHLNGIKEKSLLAERCPPARAEALRKAWRSVLGDKVNLDVDSQETFFDMGGDLIGAGVLAAHVASQGYIMNTEDVFQHPTWLSQLALLGGRAQ